MKLLKRCKHCSNTGIALGRMTGYLWGGYTVQKCNFCIHGKKVNDQKIELLLLGTFRRGGK